MEVYQLVDGPSVRTSMIGVALLKLHQRPSSEFIGWRSMVNRACACYGFDGMISADALGRPVYLLVH
jgi:hypothetical protein